MQKFDFHTHSICSDGTDTPAELARHAKEQGLSCFALTDHDTLAGLAEAGAEAKALGLGFVPGVELDIRSDFPLHILGLGIDHENETLKRIMSDAEKRRQARNDKMLKNLYDAGMDIYYSRERACGSYSRLHMALALIEKGYAKDKTDAFRRFIGSNGTAFVKSEGTPAAVSITAIHIAGGIAVLAHPSKLKCNVHELVSILKQKRLDGIEVFYPGVSESERALYMSLCSQFELIASAGSDYHGANRPESQLGCVWEDNAALEAVYQRVVLKNMHKPKETRPRYKFVVPNGGVQRERD